MAKMKREMESDDEDDLPLIARKKPKKEGSAKKRKKEESDDEEDFKPVSLVLLHLYHVIFFPIIFIKAFFSLPSF